MYGVSLYNILDEKAIKRWRANISHTMKGSNNHFYGKHHTDATKEKISIHNKAYYSTHSGSMLGKHHTLETKMKIKLRLNPKYGIAHPNHRSTICLNTMEKFDCINAGSRKFGVAYSLISRYCTHKTLSAGRKNGIPLLWMYYDEFLKCGVSFNINSRINYILNYKTGGNNPSAKKVVCITTDTIFETITEAAIFHNIDNSGIVKCCKGKIKYSGKEKNTNTKLVWVYYSDYIKSCQTSVKSEVT